MAKDYDVVVLGAGPGGYVAAIRAAQLGLKTAIIEKQWWGGVCLNVGCIPSKALLKNAELAHTLQHRSKEFGFQFDNLKMDFSIAFQRSRQVSEKLVKGVGFLMKKNKIDTFNGWGTIQDTKSIKVALNDGGEETINYKNLIIATGAHAINLPGIEVDGEVVVTYLEAIMSNKVPGSAVIIGGGPIGLEFGYVWHNYGTDVTIVELLDHLAPKEDPEVSVELEKSYKKLGVKFMTKSKVDSVSVKNGKASVKISGPDGEKTLEVDRVLVAVGFATNVEGYGLENTGIKVTERSKYIEVDGHMRTNVPNIYAIGDVTGKLMLAHVGSAQGVIAAEAIAEHPTIELEYIMMPRATYCQPQIASFGYTEAQAKEAGYNDLKIFKFPFSANGKALGLGESGGFVKLITDARYGEILGGHFIGPDVTELLPEYTLARFAELTAEEIARNVHAHPTLSEVLMEAAHGVMGHSLAI